MVRTVIVIDIARFAFVAGVWTAVLAVHIGRQMAKRK